MTQSYWAIRFYLPFEEDKTLQFIGSFENAGKRYLDDIIVFSGIYGIPDYMLWYIHKDLLAYNFSAYSIDLKLFLDGDPESCYFNENYRIIDVGDDLKSDRKLVYAIQEDYAKLETLLIDAEVTTLEYKETRTVETLLKEVLEEGGIFPVIFCEHKEQELESIKFEYPKFTIDPSWTVRDFIQYIAEENGFEWTIKHGMLFIGPELYTYKEMKASKDYLNRQVDNISKNYWNVKISWAASPLDVLYYYELIDEEKLTDMRCVWAKHWVGANGDTTKGCFVQVGRSIDKTSFIQSLEGMKEITNAYHYLFKVPKHHQLSMARTIKDEGDNQFVDDVTLQKKIEEYTKKTPRNVVMETTESLYTLPKVGRTTPYLDDGAGILFPRVKDVKKAPNQILMAINDRIEQAVMGPFVMGNGDSNFVIPAKNPDDFRFSLPNGVTVYVKSDKTIILQQEVSPSSVPSGSGTFIKIEPNGNITIEGEGDLNLNAGWNVVTNGGGLTKLQNGNYTLSHGTHTHQIPPGPAIPGPPVFTAPTSDNTTKTKGD